MIISEIPSLPWETVAADIFEVEGIYYQVIVDHYSFYFEIQKLPNITATQIIRACFGIFSHFGFPKVVRVDNGRQYASTEFKREMQNAGVKLVFSSPYHSQGNAIAERAVREAKKILRNFKYGTTGFYKAMLDWRNSPRDPELGSPAQRLMARKLRGENIELEENLKPQVISPKKVKNRLYDGRSQQKYYYDRTAQHGKQFNRGDQVMVQHPLKKTWQPGTVLEKRATPRSYVIQLRHTGTEVDRNSKLIRNDPNESTQAENISVMDISIEKSQTQPAEDQQIPTTSDNTEQKNRKRIRQQSNLDQTIKEIENNVRPPKKRTRCLKIINETPRRSERLKTRLEKDESQNPTSDNGSETHVTEESESDLDL